jgi:hypothetical protein
MLSVNGQTGPVIFDHAVYGDRVADSPLKVVKFVATHAFGRTTVPAKGICKDCGLRFFWLSEEEPVVPPPRVNLITAQKVLENRNAIEFTLNNRRRLY